MECDLYARIDCGNNETCKFVLLMFGSGDLEDVPVFEDEVVSEHRKIFSALEFAVTPNSLVRRVDTNIAVFGFDDVCFDRLFLFLCPSETTE